MKGKIVTLFALITLLLPILALHSASAVDLFQSTCPGGSSQTAVCKDIGTSGIPGPNPVIHAIRFAISLVALIVGIAAVITIIIGGFRIVTSNGDAQGVAKARSSIAYALIGLVVAALAETIVVFVLNKL